MKYQNIENFPNIDSWKIIDNNCFYFFYKKYEEIFISPSYFFNLNTKYTSCLLR